MQAPLVVALPKEKVIEPSESLVAVTLSEPPTEARPGTVTVSRGVPRPTVMVGSVLAACQSALPAWVAVTTQGPAWLNRPVVPVTEHASHEVANVTSSPGLVVACSG